MENESLEVVKKDNFVKRLYDWVLSWADSPYGPLALFLLAFAEASFFPVPPDVLQMALALGEPRKSFKFAFISTIGSTLGGLLGYYIGFALMSTWGMRLLAFYGAIEKFDYLKELYSHYGATFLAIAGFTPIPYKVFTIASGAFKVNLIMFIVVSILSRAGRFFLVAVFFYFWGEKAKGFIEKYFNILSILFIILLLGGFYLIKVFL